jgi:mRNA-degrading endonuclease RelE of RelBE toxin-antitoxin system
LAQPPETITIGGRRFEINSDCWKTYEKLSEDARAAIGKAIEDAPEGDEDKKEQTLKIQLSTGTVQGKFIKSETSNKITGLSFQKKQGGTKALKSPPSDPSRKAERVKKGSAAKPPPPPAAETKTYTFLYHKKWGKDTSTLTPDQKKILDDMFARMQQNPLAQDDDQHEYHGIKVTSGGKCFTRYLDRANESRVLFAVNSDRKEVRFLGVVLEHNYKDVAKRQFDACQTPEELEERARDAAARSTRKPPPPAEEPTGDADAPPPPARPPQPPPPAAPPIGPADDLPPLINRDPGLPGLLYALGNCTVLTDIRIDAGPFGPFLIYHVPDDGNCLFAAIGLFVGLDQANVRRRIHVFAQDILQGKRENPNPAVFTQVALRAIANITRPDGQNVFGNDAEARMAAVVFQRRVFIVNHFHGGGTSAYEGYNAQGNPIDMANLNPPINPGQNPGDDIVLYFILNPEDPRPGERHIEALIQP